MSLADQVDTTIQGVFPTFAWYTCQLGVISEATRTGPYIDTTPTWSAGIQCRFKVHNSLETRSGAQTPLGDATCTVAVGIAVTGVSRVKITHLGSSAIANTTWAVEGDPVRKPGGIALTLRRITDGARE